MKHDLSIGSVSFIRGDPSPVTWSTAAVRYNPHWIPKTCIGLVATRNEQPPDTIPDFSQFAATKEFRALAYCQLSIDIDDATGKVRAVAAKNSLFHGGYTAPFRKTWALAYFGAWAGSEHWNNDYNPGEKSLVSTLATGARHWASTIAPLPGETVLANTLVKFRAGPETDRIGTDQVGSPFHVPWVWCEALVTLTGNRLKLYGRGSVFPTHYWYLDGKNVQHQPEVADESFPTLGAPSSVPSATYEIDTKRLRLYPVLSRGRPAWTAAAAVPGAPTPGPPAPVGQWPPAQESACRGPVDRHPYTIDAGSVLTYESVFPPTASDDGPISEGGPQPVHPR